MKKILFVMPGLSVGGLERVQVSIANALSKKGHDVTVMILNPEYTLAKELDKRVKLVHKPYKPHKIMKKIPYIRGKFYDDGMWETRASAKKLYNYYVGQEKFDVEIAFFRGLSIKIVSGSTNKNSIKIAWVHSDFAQCYGYTNNFKNIDETKKAYREFDKIVTVSKQAKESFSKVIGIEENVCAVYNLLDIEDILNKSNETIDIVKQKTTIMSVGRVVELKGFDRLINVAERLNNDGFDFDLWIVGDGSQREELQQIVEQKNLTNVKFLGSQANPYKYMKQADLYVCSSRYEGYNLTVAEALILGVPVLSTHCTGPCEILDDGKYGVIVENSEEGLYAGIKDLLEHPEKLAYYKEKAIARKDFFNEERIIGEIEELFGE